MALYGYCPFTTLLSAYPGAKLFHLLSNANCLCQALPKSSFFFSITSMHNSCQQLGRAEIQDNDCTPCSALTTLSSQTILDLCSLLYRCRDVFSLSYPSRQWNRTGSCWSPVRILPVAPLWCDLGLVPNSSGNKAAANLGPAKLVNNLLNIFTTSISNSATHVMPIAAKCVFNF